MPTFRKKERLCSRRVIDGLFMSSHKFIVFPLSVHWMPLDSDGLTAPVQTLIVAPKKKLHHAVDRNRAKRLMRECYRMRKQKIIDLARENNICIAISISFVDNSLPDYHHLSARFDKVVDTLTKQISETLTNTSQPSCGSLAE